MSDPVLYCLESNCLYGRKEKKNSKKLDMTQCFLCYRLFHDDCVAPNKKDIPGGWPCHECRTLTAQVKQLQVCVTALMTSVESIKNDLTKSLENSATLIEKCNAFTVENATLKQAVTELTAEVQRQDFKRDAQNDEETDTEDDDEDVQQLGSVLFGDSIIRSLASTDDDLKINCISGAKVSDIRKSIRQINPKKQKFKDMYIVCGTNDVATKKPIDKIGKDFENLIVRAKERSESVHIASITPRNDDDAHKAKLEKMNELLVNICRTAEVNFIDNDKNFRYRDGSIDESLLLAGDKLHLSSNGTKKLLSNLGLEGKAKVTLVNEPRSFWNENGNVTSPKPASMTEPKPPTSYEATMMDAPSRNVSVSNGAQPIKFRGPQSSFSNFFPAPLRMWGMTFQTNEHAYNYRKALEMGQHETAENIRKAPTPRRAQLMAQDIVTNERWKGLKQSVMYELLKEKSRQCPTFRKDLIDSGDRILVEDTSHPYWGRGNAGSGLNALGRLLMTLRQNLPNVAPPMATKQTSQNHHYSNSFPSNDRQSRCYNCGEKSHNLKTCRHPSPLQCYSCFDHGH